MKPGSDLAITPGETGPREIGSTPTGGSRWSHCSSSSPSSSRSLSTKPRLARQGRTVAAEALQPIVAMKMPQPPPGCLPRHGPHLAPHHLRRPPPRRHRRLPRRGRRPGRQGRGPRPGNHHRARQPALHPNRQGPQARHPLPRLRHPHVGQRQDPERPLSRRPRPLRRRLGCSHLDPRPPRRHHPPAHRRRRHPLPPRRKLHRLADLMVPSGTMARVPVMADGGFPARARRPASTMPPWVVLGR